MCLQVGSHAYQDCVASVLKAPGAWCVLKNCEGRKGGEAEGREGSREGEAGLRSTLSPPAPWGQRPSLMPLREGPQGPHPTSIPQTPRESCPWVQALEGSRAQDRLGATRGELC